MKKISFLFISALFLIAVMVRFSAANAETGIRISFNDHHRPPSRHYYGHDHWPFGHTYERTVFVPVYVELPAPERFSVNPREGGNELTWSKAPGNDYGYFIMRSENEGKSYTMIQFVNFDVTSYVDSDVKNGTTYYYMVENAYRNGTGGNPSNVVAVRTICKNTPQYVIVPKSVQAASAPAAQADASAAASAGKAANATTASAGARKPKSAKDLEPPASIAAKYSDDSISVIWSASKNAVSYEIFRASEDPTSNFQKIGEVKGETSYEDSAVEKSMQYFYYVVAVNRNGISKKSRIASAFDASTK